MAKNVVEEIRRATAPEVHFWSGAGPPLVSGRPPPVPHHPAGGAGPLPRFHLPALPPHRLEERAADETQHGRDVHVTDLAFRAGHREAPAEPVVPQVRLGVFSLALAVGCVQDYSRS